MAVALYFGKMKFAFTGCICTCLVLALLSVLHKFLWTPIRIQNLFRRQGIRGPAYKFLRGTTTAALKMRQDSLSYPMDVSDHSVFPKTQPHIYSWVNIYGKIFLMWLGARPQLVVTDVKLIKEVLNHKEGVYGRPEMSSFVKKMLGDGLLIVDEDDKWLKLRKLANHAFYAESLKGMIPAMIESAEMMLKRWSNGEGKEMDAFEEFKQFSAEVISRTAFGSSYLEGQKIFDMLRKLAMIIAKHDMKIRFPGIGRLVQTQDDIDSSSYKQGMRNAIVEMIKKREKKVMSGEEDNFGNDFLGLLLRNHHSNDEKSRVSVDEMVDECKSFYLTGQETTYVLLSWATFLLASNTDWQEKLRSEVMEVFGHQNPRVDSISKLKFMTMFLNETLRLYSPIGLMGRRTKREVKLGELTIPANVELIIPILALHHNPEIWGEDVNQFKPERFAEGLAKATNGMTSAFMPFGSGPRSCVGLNFTLIESKIAISMILQRYRLILSHNYIHSPVQQLTTVPANGVLVMVQKL